MLKLKKIYLLILALCLSTSMFAQKDKQAREVLDKSSDEVNISTPTPEELQGINPYSLLSLYKSGYNYKYAGMKTRNGKQGYEVTLTPEKKQEIASITLFVSKTYEPLYIKILQSNKTVNEIIVSSYQTHQPLDNESFRFDKRKYPNAEVIDLRN